MTTISKLAMDGWWWKNSPPGKSYKELNKHRLKFTNSITMSTQKLDYRCLLSLSFSLSLSLSLSLSVSISLSLSLILMKFFYKGGRFPSSRCQGQERGAGVWAEPWEVPVPEVGRQGLQEHVDSTARIRDSASGTLFGTLFCHGTATNTFNKN